jgi:sporulation protein YlmC with PRC-barrel domain
MVPHAWVGSRHFIDSRVQNHNNELLGHVREIFLDVATGHIDYVLVACGGLFGVGRKLVAVPWSELSPTYGDQALIWEKSPSEIDAMPRAQA